MPKIKFIRENKVVEVDPGTNLRRAALDSGVNVYPGIHQFPLAHCPGWGSCATCRVLIKKGVENISRPGWKETLRMLLGPLTIFFRIGHEKDLRLSCQTTVNGDVEVETLPEPNWHGERFWG